jgi:hypothetical protein
MVLSFQVLRLDHIVRRDSTQLFCWVEMSRVGRCDHSKNLQKLSKTASTTKALVLLQHSSAPRGPHWLTPVLCRIQSLVLSGDVIAFTTRLISTQQNCWNVQNCPVLLSWVFRVITSPDDELRWDELSWLTSGDAGHILTCSWSHFVQL